MTKSEQMARVRSRNTAPELRLRKELWKRGVHYRLHRSDLPGSPDVYVGRLRLAVFVNGCFWHGHKCSRGKRPTSNEQFWNAKIERNCNRDTDAIRSLERLGIESLTLWTCDILDFGTMAERIATRYDVAR